MNLKCGCGSSNQDAVQLGKGHDCSSEQVSEVQGPELE